MLGIILKPSQTAVCGYMAPLTQLHGGLQDRRRPASQVARASGGTAAGGAGGPVGSAQRHHVEGARCIMPAFTQADLLASNLTALLLSHAITRMK